MEILFEIFGWVRIVLSPLLIGSGIGAAIYFTNPNTLTLALGIFLSAFGLTIGIIWATRVWKKYGTMNFVSRVNATPDIDEWIKKEKEKN